jgi:hypothetical protein
MKKTRGRKSHVRVPLNIISPETISFSKSTVLYAVLYSFNEQKNAVSWMEWFFVTVYEFVWRKICKGFFLMWREGFCDNIRNNSLPVFYATPTLCYIFKICLCCSSSSEAEPHSRYGSGFVKILRLRNLDWPERPHELLTWCTRWRHINSHHEFL